MLKVSPWKGAVRFGKREKLNPRYVGPFKVLAKVRAIAYKLELPQELSGVYNTFCVSNLKKGYADEPLAVSLDGLHIDDKLHFIEEPDPKEYDKEILSEDPADYLAENDEEEEERAATIRLRAESLSTSHPLSLPPPIVLLRTKASMAMMRVVTPSTYCLASRSETTLSGTPPILPIPLPISSPPLLSPSTNYRADVIEVTLPPQKRLCIALGPRYEITESSFVPTARPTRGFREDYGFVGTLDAEIRRDLYREVSYRIIDTWDEMVEAIQEIAPTTLEGVNQRVMDLITTVRQDTNEIYGRLDNAHDDRSLMSGQLNLLRRDRRSHARTTRLMKSEARASREAWAVNRKRQAQLVEALTLMRTLQTKMAALQSQ
ncbi:hypothetical protein Tco_0763341 [Tanacetum coccineum]